MTLRLRKQRTVYVHCGLHKTGTSAIQATFDQHRQSLLAEGLLYPASGDAHTGHHNLAWEIAGDRRFDATALTIADAVAQIAAFDGDAVLSSEDFESFLHRPQTLAPLVRPLRAAGRRVSLVVYFREPRAYARSLYAELLRHDYAATFDEFRAEIDAHGMLRYREWVFQFAYRRVRSALAAYRDAGVLPRRYDLAMRSGSVVSDLLRLLGLPADLFGEAARQVHHESDTPACTVARFISNRTGRPLTESERQTLERLLRQAQAATKSSPPLTRLCSAETASAIEALAASPSDRAERALLDCWGAPTPRSWAERLQSMRQLWA